MLVRTCRPASGSRQCASYPALTWRCRQGQANISWWHCVAGVCCFKLRHCLAHLEKVGLPRSFSHKNDVGLEALCCRGDHLLERRPHGGVTRVACMSK